MSEKNREGKRTARERVQEQRERDQARDRRKRGLVVGAVGVTVLGVAAAVGVAISQADSGTDDAGGSVVVPSGAGGEDSLAIPVGERDAPSTLTVYEDFRCPACGQFENGYRSTVHRLARQGRMKIEYHLVAIIDGNLGGQGSRNAANAAACAQDAGRFAAYHDVLYKNQPPETDDAFADKNRLIKLAGRVEGLSTPSFRSCVEDGAHDGWVRKSQTAFGASGHTGTPTVLLDGKNVYADQQNPLTPARLTKLVAAAAKS